MTSLFSPADLHRLANGWRGAGKSIGLVPTMGAFHQGHLSLMRRARAECDVVVVSLFVNPTQFGPAEDLSAYPRDRERDRALAEQERVDALYEPSVETMYPSGYATRVQVERLGEGLCGVSRPGHFRGVATVCAKLFNTCKPHRVYFGAKDYQQSVVLEQMICDLDLDVQLVRCPIVREPDGLALSSRNAYLTPQERRAATILSRALTQAQELIAQGARDASWLRQQVCMALQSEPLAQLDYAEIVDARTLAPVDRIGGPNLIAVAARFGKARLIDNLVLEIDS